MTEEDRESGMAEMIRTTTTKSTEEIEDETIGLTSQSDTD